MIVMCAFSTRGTVLHAPPASWTCRRAGPGPSRAPHGWHAGRHVPISAAASPDTAAAPSSRSEQQLAFEELVAQHATSSSVCLQPCQHGYGLFLERDAAPGDVLLSIPTSSCLVVDYNAGLQLPPGQWPRLKKGLGKDGAMPWDLLQALALLDALSGAGGAFWERYAATLLPAPASLALPTCLPDPPLLGELQHGAIIAGARAQKERLQGLFPGLSALVCEGGPTWVEWAFGCVRSRAFRLGPDTFAFVPFLDAANHSGEPTCDFRLASDGSGVDLVAVKAAGAGEEATISYTGPQGMTNQRLMAQYGFVPPHGNTADRLAFAALEPPVTDAAAVQQQQQQQQQPPLAPAASPPSPPVLLSLDRLQACLGDGEAMAAAFSGRDPYAYAALKSLPLALEESAAASWQAQAELAGALLGELESEKGGWPTSPLHDQELLSTLAAPAGAGGTGGGTDARVVAAVQYRLQRKLLVLSATALLRRFLGP